MTCHLRFVVSRPEGKPAEVFGQRVNPFSVKS
jgi:hypothetical protein